MWKRVATLLAVLSITTTAAARPQDDRSACAGANRASCRYILDATAAFAGMLATADPSPLQRHLDPRALWISSDGKVRTGSQLIDTVRGDTRRATATLDQAQVHVLDNVAIVTWQESWTAPDQAVKAGRLAGVDTWLRRGRTWKVVATVEARPKP